MLSLKSPRAVAEFLGVSYRTVLRLIEAGELGAYRVGARLRVSDEQIADYLSAHVRFDGSGVPDWSRPVSVGTASLVRLSQELQAEGS